VNEFLKQALTPEIRMNIDEVSETVQQFVQGHSLAISGNEPIDQNEAQENFFTTDH